MNFFYFPSSSNSSRSEGEGGGTVLCTVMMYDTKNGISKASISRLDRSTSINNPKGARKKYKIHGGVKVVRVGRRLYD